MGARPGIKPPRGGEARPVIAGLSPRGLLVGGVLVGLGLWLHGLIGLLLLAVGADLAVSRRPFTPRPICRPALGFAAAGMLLVDPAVALACGWLVELACDPALVPVPASGGEPGEGCR